MHYIIVIQNNITYFYSNVINNNINSFYLISYWYQQYLLNLIISNINYKFNIY